jgi:DNA-binding transcriptional MerR regulator
MKSPEAFRTISEVADVLDVPPHVLRFWETRFAQVKPVKRGGGRRYYRPEDVCLLRGIRGLLYDDGMTIKGVQKILREKGVRHVVGLGTGPVIAHCEIGMEPTVGIDAARAEPGAPPRNAVSVPGRSGSRTPRTDLFATLPERPVLAMGFAESRAAGIPALDAPASSHATIAAAGHSPQPEISMSEPQRNTRAGQDDASAPAATEQSMGRARKDALKALIAEFQALRARMAEGPPR